MSEAFDQNLLIRDKHTISHAEEWRYFTVEQRDLRKKQGPYYVSLASVKYVSSLTHIPEIIRCRRIKNSFNIWRNFRKLIHAVWRSKDWFHGSLSCEIFCMFNLATILRMKIKVDQTFENIILRLYVW